MIKHAEHILFLKDASTNRDAFSSYNGTSGIKKSSYSLLWNRRKQNISPYLEHESRRVKMFRAAAARPSLSLSCTRAPQSCSERASGAALMEKQARVWVCVCELGVTPNTHSIHLLN